MFYILSILWWCQIWIHKPWLNPRCSQVLCPVDQPKRAPWVADATGHGVQGIWQILIQSCQSPAHWMVFVRKIPVKKGWFGGTPILGKPLLITHHGLKFNQTQIRFILSKKIDLDKSWSDRPDPVLTIWRCSSIPGIPLKRKPIGLPIVQPGSSPSSQLLLCQEAKLLSEPKVIDEEASGGGVFPATLDSDW